MNVPINNLVPQKAGVVLSGLLVGKGTSPVSVAVAADVSTALDLIGSTQGNILYRSATGWNVLAPGTSGMFLKTQGAGADPVWASGNSGDVVGPASSVTNRIVTFSGTTGKLVQDASGLTALAGAIASNTLISLTAGGTNQNITLTPSGTGIVILAGSVRMSSYTAGVIKSDGSGNLTSGTVTAVLGGTGQILYAVGDLLYASTTTALSKLAAVAAGQVLVSAGIGTAPAWSSSPTLSGKLTLTASTSDSSLVLGGLEMQSFAVGNEWLASNTYYDGTSFKYRAAGTSQMVNFASGKVQVRIAASGSAGGTVTQTNVGEFSLTGLAVTGVLSTSAPAGSSVQPWKLGNVQAGAVTVDLTRSVFIDIAGTVYKLLVAA